jgi:Rod binding domain-containing protein
MSTTMSPIFNQPVFGAAGHKPNAQAAAQGFSSIFAQMFAKEMRQAMVGDGSGMPGMGGESSDIFNGFFDEAMGKTLASSPAMRPLNNLLLHEIGGSGKDAASQLGAGKIVKTGASASGSYETQSGNGGAVATPRIDFSTRNLAPGGDRGPLLLPPPPSLMAPILPPPSPLES